MWKLAIALVGFIIFAALFRLAISADVANDLAQILIPAFGAILIMGLAISIAPWFDKNY